MNSTVPLPLMPTDPAGSNFLPVAEVFFHPPLARGRFLPMALQLENGAVVRVRLSSPQVAALLSQLSALGIQARL